MLSKNMGRVDRTLRFIVGVVLILIGLAALRGGEGNLTGVVVAVVAVVPTLTALIGFCPLYLPFGVSTLGRDRSPSEPLEV